MIRVLVCFILSSPVVWILERNNFPFTHIQITRERGRKERRRRGEEERYGRLGKQSALCVSASCLYLGSTWHN